MVLGELARQAELNVLDGAVFVLDMYIDQNGFEQIVVAWMKGGIGKMRPELFEVISENR